MTQRAKEQLDNLRETTRRYSSEVEKKLSRNGQSNEALVESAAKYYPALKKLAEK
jgi:hypothetical protein